MSSSEALDFDSMLLRLRGPLDLPPVVDRDSRLSDSGIDSISMVELLATLEELGAEVPEYLIDVLETFGDVYHAYVTGLSR